MSDQFPESTAMKLSTAKQKKETADQAFKEGNLKGALLSYHEALMFLLGLDKNALQSIGVGSATPVNDKDGKDAKEKTEVDEIIEKIYANMSACHMKNENWKRAVETADKALAKNEANFKAMFRKGKALGEMGFFDKAVKILEEVKEKNPTDAPAVDAELSRLRAIDNERERANKQKLKGFLNRAEKKTAAVTRVEESETA
ncbi:putative bone development [Lyophyllum shimeji]|uniref:Bone development n=1 Tax=Lyophyllum shimeji TaxID=47721 RepID=A0A9P3PRR0_LYOSH|nr:putative bone development [Lyophyllum shimeji]